MKRLPEEMSCRSRLQASWLRICYGAPSQLIELRRYDIALALESTPDSPCLGIKVKQEFAAKEKAKKTPPSTAKAAKKAA